MKSVVASTVELSIEADTVLCFPLPGVA